MDKLTIFMSLPDTPIGWITLIAVVVVVLGIAGLAVYLAIKLLKDGKINQLRDAIVEAVKQAEKTHASGAEKKKIAIETVKKFCEGIGLKLDDRLLNWVADYIEKYIRDHNELELIEEEEGK